MKKVLLIFPCSMGLHNGRVKFSNFFAMIWHFFMIYLILRKLLKILIGAGDITTRPSKCISGGPAPTNIFQLTLEIQFIDKNRKGPQKKAKI